MLRHIPQLVQRLVVVGARNQSHKRGYGFLLFSQRCCGTTGIMSKGNASRALGEEIGELKVSSGAHEHLMEKMKGLSPEDQKLILDALQNPDTQPNSTMGGPGIGTKSADMVAAFTCGRCDYRMVKKFSKHAYTKGIVLVECPSCQVRHLIADNLGWFTDEARNIEEILREKGESFVRIGRDFQVEPSSDNNTPATD